MKFSLTYAGVIATILGPVLAQSFGWTDACSTEVATTVSMLPGALLSLVGRYKAGGVNMAGFKVK